MSPLRPIGDRDVGEDPAQSLVAGGRRRPLRDATVVRGDVDVAVGAGRLEQAELGDVAETVAWVTSKPCSVSASTSSRWLPTGRDATSSRMARWRSRLSSWPWRRLLACIAGSCGADAGASRVAVMRVPNVGSVERALERVRARTSRR